MERTLPGCLLRRPVARRGAALAALLVALALAGTARPEPAQAATWVVKGGGFGHGVGMSAYGAYGFGKKGVRPEKILKHYYAKVRIKRKKRSRNVRVLLGTSGGSVQFRGARRACGTKLNPAKAYAGRRSGKRVVVTNRSGRRLARCTKKLRAIGNRGKLRITGYGTYRGALDLVPNSSGTLNVINNLDVNDYVRGSLPAELFPSWPVPTLRAFAIAIRSIALSTDVGGAGFELYPDTRTQVYKGVKVETKRTDRAVRATLNKVVAYKGRTIQATYFSASGGRTESRFLGGPKVPYFKSVKDPYDHYSPLHRWRYRFSQREMNQRLGGLINGRLKRIKILKRGDSPRVDYARLVARGGSVKVRGDTLAAALGLPDRWMRFKKVKGRAAARVERKLPGPPSRAEARRAAIPRLSPPAR